MSTTNDADLEFPTTEPMAEWDSPDQDTSLRDWFAVHAPVMPDNFERKSRFIQTVVPADRPGHKRLETVTELEAPARHLARWAYSYADAMLAEREKK